MPSQRWFLLGDIASNVFIGVLSSVICALWFDASDGMLMAMLLGMVVSMLIAMPSALILGRYFGALELMLSMMLTAMLSGMVVAMRASMGPLLVFDIVLYGVFSAVVVLLWVKYLDRRDVAMALREEEAHD